MKLSFWRRNNTLKSILVMGSLSLLIQGCSGDNSGIQIPEDQTITSQSISENCTGETTVAGTPTTTSNSESVTIQPEQPATLCTETPEEVVLYTPPDEAEDEPELTQKTCNTRELYSRVPAAAEFIVSARPNDFFHSLFGKALLSDEEIQLQVQEASDSIDVVLQSVKQSVVNLETISVFLDVEVDETDVDEPTKKNAGILIEFYKAMLDEEFTTLQSEFQSAGTFTFEDFPGDNPPKLNVNYLSHDDIAIRVNFTATVYDEDTGVYEDETGSPLECAIEKKFITCAFSDVTTSADYIEELASVRDLEAPSIIDNPDNEPLKHCDTLQVYALTSAVSTLTAEDLNEEESKELTEELTKGGVLFANLNVFPAKLLKTDAMFGLARFSVSYRIGESWVGRLTLEVGDFVAKYIRKIVQQSKLESEDGSEDGVDASPPVLHTDPSALELLR